MMTARKEVAARWGFLREWLAVLQQHLYYHEREEVDCSSLHSELKTFCVYVPWPPEETDAYNATLRRLREALELVALALRVDKDVWKLVRRPRNPLLRNFDPSDYDECDLELRYLFKAFERTNASGDNLASIRALTRLIDSTSLNEKYIKARRTIVHRDVRGRLRGFRIPITLLFTPETMSANDAREYCSLAKRLVTDVISATNQISSDYARRYPFVLKWMIFQPWEIAIDETVEAVITSSLLSPYPITIAEVALNLANTHHTMLGRVLLPVSRRLGADHRGRVDALMISGDSMQGFTSLSSTILSSETLSMLHFYSALGEERTAKWRLLGFALFSRASKSSIREVWIDEEQLLLSDVAALRSMVKSANPLRDVSPTYLSGSKENSSPDDMCFVKLAPSAQIRLDRDGHEHSLQALRLQEVDWFYCLNGSSGEFAVILAPGYGAVFVSCGHIIDTKGLDVESRRPAGLSILRLAFNRGDQGIIAELIRTIGSSLVSLDLDVDDSSLIRTSDIEAILDTSRHLKLLRINRAKIDSLDVFVDAYEKKTCRISTLALWNVRVRNSSLRDFALTLAKPTHPMAKTLVEFRYIYDDGVEPGEIQRPDNRGVQLFLDMLKVNYALSFFELGISEHQDERYGASLRALDGHLLVTHPSDLKLPLKLAFLSCVSVIATGAPKKTRRRVEKPSLPRSAVERIFQFARRRIHRVVSVKKVVDVALQPLVA